MGHIPTNTCANYQTKIIPHVGSDCEKIILFNSLCGIVIVGCVSAATPADNQTVNETATTAPQLIGGDMGTYLVKANADGANVTFDSDFKGITKEGQLKVEVCTTGMPYRVITVEKSGYAVYTANITSVPAKNETVEIPVTLIPLAAANTTAQQANATATEAAGSPANVTADVTTTVATATATSPAPTQSGSLPFAAFDIIGTLAIRSRR
ncbi:hypothetical protein [Methanoregula sp.]|jgi:hypothetical protein|uniref:hypothetical protein n=1 Tax=Methanoregula sp. TaxID=2052170 RepID=UPI0025E91D96|nr:hypothetical protein [Methanoregula sp.]